MEAGRGRRFRQVKVSPPIKTSGELNRFSSREGCEVLRFSKRSVFFTVLATLLSVTFFLWGSLAVQAGEQEALLREIEDYIERYYLYAPEEEFRPLASLDELNTILIDPYSGYLSAEQFQSFDEGMGRSIEGVGVYLELREERPTVVSTLPGSPAFRAGLESGDVIVAVDMRPVEGLSLEEVVARISGEAGTTVLLIARREGELLTFEITREKITFPLAEYIWLEEGIARMIIYSFGQGAAGEVEALLSELEEQGLKGLIIDLRANSGGYVEEALEITAFFTEGDLLLVKDRMSGWSAVGVEKEPGFDFPLVLLSGKGTASAAELMAAALKDNFRAVLVGVPSFGKGTIQSLFPLQAGGFLKLTTAEFVSPRGNFIEGDGVEPHFLAEGEEEQAQGALNLLRYEVGLANGSSFLGALLQEKREEDGRTALPRQHGGKLYYPLRASLLGTGREIHPGGEPWLYYFTWEGRRYEIDIRDRSISWENPAGEQRSSTFILEEGTSYVEKNFWKEALGIPFY